MRLVIQVNDFLEDGTGLLNNLVASKTSSAIPVVANVMLTVLVPQEDGLKLWWVVVKPPVEVKVGLRALWGFVIPCENFKRADQLQTQRVFQGIYTG